ncbi:unnamed protein product [Owenia fusiformis]|uniref:Uncharacterized protein n=1 Tax=Owenia fusiformis TaxID=6347 RepID=A0A8J1U4I0_OWEFU|nr:unnamed protein product [Owenia fusiformis]
MIRVAVLGATGQTGTRVVQQALDAGHAVKALVRSPEKMSIKHERLQIEKVNIFDTSSMLPHFKDTDAIVHCVGVNVQWNPTTLFSDSIKAIVEAMRGAQIKKIAILSLQLSDAKISEEFGWLMKWAFSLFFWFIKPITDDVVKMEHYLQGECDDLEWTAVKPVQLVNKPPSGKIIHHNEGQYLEGGQNWTISRGDVAKFMLQVVTSKDKEFANKLISMGTKD